MDPFHPVCRTPPGLVLPVGVDATGRAGPTRGQAANRGWRRVGQNRYVPADVDPTVPEQRILEASIHVPPGGAITGWAGLRLARGSYFDGRGRSGDETHDVLIATGATQGRRRHPGIALTYEPLGPDESWYFFGVPVALPVRCTFDELRRPDLGPEAVVALDMAMAATLVTPERLSAYLAERRAWRRSSLVVRALALAARGSRSPGESRSRLEWLSCGFPTPLLNREIFTLDGRFVCEADMLDVEAGMVVEYDGSEHLKLGRRAKDVARQQRCGRVQLEYCTVTAPDLHTPAVVRERFVWHRDRALFLPPEKRLWTLEAPPGWLPYR